MRIDRLTIRNFKGFKHREFRFDPRFNLIAGVNGAGKTSLLDALAVAAGSWLLGIRDQTARHIKPFEILQDPVEESGEIVWHRRYPCEIEAEGEVMGKPVSWKRVRNSEFGRTTYADAARIKDTALDTDNRVRAGERGVAFPLLAYYGTGRLSDMPRAHALIKNEKALIKKENFSRFEGYRECLDPRLSVKQLMEWVARREWIEFQEKRKPRLSSGESLSFSRILLDAIAGYIEDALGIDFEAKRGEISLVLGNLYLGGMRIQPFSNLSDGQRVMLAMVGDIAQRAARLNPHWESARLWKPVGLCSLTSWTCICTLRGNGGLSAISNGPFPTSSFSPPPIHPSLSDRRKPKRFCCWTLKDTRAPGKVSGWIPIGCSSMSWAARTGTRKSPGDWTRCLICWKTNSTGRRGAR